MQKKLSKIPNQIKNIPNPKTTELLTITIAISIQIQQKYNIIK